MNNKDVTPFKTEDNMIPENRMRLTAEEVKARVDAIIETIIASGANLTESETALRAKIMDTFAGPSAILESTVCANPLGMAGEVLTRMGVITEAEIEQLMKGEIRNVREINPDSERGDWISSVQRGEQGVVVWTYGDGRGNHISGLSTENLPEVAVNITMPYDWKTSLKSGYVSPAITFINQK